MHRIVTLLVLLGLLVWVSAGTATAQEPTPIEYGQTVTGEITDENYEFVYTFNGSEGDVVIVEMAQTSALGDLRRPEVTLTDDRGTPIATTADRFSISRAILVTELPFDGEYTVIATRLDGEDGDSVGEFTLSLLRPPVFNVGETIQDSISTQDGEQYYVVRPETAFGLEYQRSGGTMVPQLEISAIGSEADFDSQAALSGPMITIATVGVFEAAEIHIITVSRSIYQSAIEERSADFLIKLIPFSEQE
jgi:hypothetical protein